MWEIRFLLKHRDSVAKLSSSSDIGWAKLLYFSMKPLVEVVDKVFFCDHYEWSDFLTCQEIWMWCPFGVKPLKSWHNRLWHPGLHGALHTKTGLARHPVMGKWHGKHKEPSGLCFLLVAPDLGSVEETWLFRRQAQRPWVQARYWIELNWIE